MPSSKIIAVLKLFSPGSSFLSSVLSSKYPPILCTSIPIKFPRPCGMNNYPTLSSTKSSILFSFIKTLHPTLSRPSVSQLPPPYDNPSKSHLGLIIQSTTLCESNKPLYTVLYLKSKTPHAGKLHVTSILYPKYSTPILCRHILPSLIFPLFGAPV